MKEIGSERTTEGGRDRKTGTDGRKSEDPSVFGLLVNQLLQSTQGEILRRDRPSVVGPVCFSCGDGGHRINRCPQVNTDFPFLPAGWSMNMDNGQYRAKRMNRRLAEEPGNEQRSEWEGQPLH